MNIKNLKSCISHDEATIRSFIRNPEFADFYLKSVIADGDIEEIQQVQDWYNEAKARMQDQSYWDDVVNHAELAVKNGYDLKIVLNSLNDATNLVKAAMA